VEGELLSFPRGVEVEAERPSSARVNLLRRHPPKLCRALDLVPPTQPLVVLYTDQPAHTQHHIVVVFLPDEITDYTRYL
jgi:hypothetical protein